MVLSTKFTTSNGAAINLARTLIHIDEIFSNETDDQQHFFPLQLRLYCSKYTLESRKIFTVKNNFVIKTSHKNFTKKSTQ